MQYNPQAAFETLYWSSTGSSRHMIFSSDQYNRPMTESNVEKPVVIFLAATGSIAIFSVMNLFLKLGADQGIPIPQLLFFRGLLGLIPVLYLIHKSQTRWALLKTERHGGHFVRSFIGFFSMACFFWSFALLPLANATAIHFASPLIITALSVMFLNEKVGPHRWTAVLVGLGAVLFMLQPAGDGDPIGSLIAMCAAILAAFAMITVRQLGRTEHALSIVFYFSIYCTLFSGVWTFHVWVTPDLTGLFYLLTIGLLGGLGQVLLTHAYAKAPAAYVSAFSYSSIVFATAFDFLIWHHTPAWQVLVGSTVVIASGLYILWRETRKRSPIITNANVYGASPARPTERDRLDNTPEIQ